MEPMDEHEAREFIAHNRFGVLSLADDGRAYGIPLFYAYDGGHIYFHTRPGRKDDYMPRTQEACFTIVRVVTLDDWASVQVLGTLDEVEDERGRDAAVDALLAIPLPPAWGFTQTGEPRRRAAGLRIWRLRVERVAGRLSERPELTEREKTLTYG